jgi:O-antigen ligase
MDRWTDEPMTRSPGTGVRLLLFLLALVGSWVLLLTGFPPGAPDRLPVLLIAFALALLAARSPQRGVVAFAFLFPCVGLLVRLFGATDPSTWPTLLFAGLAVGWTFRFLYDFESVSEPAPLDRWLTALAAIWIFSTVLAAARAQTLWAAVRGLTGRAVNSQGLLDAEAVRESVFSLSAVAAGAAFYFLLRRSGSAARERAVRAAVWGVAVSAGAAALQRLHVLPAEARGFWRLTGRLSGGAVDPNSLGLLCGLAIVLALTRGARSGARGLDFGLVAVLVAGLLLSGSRSGFLLVLLSLAVLALSRGLPPRVRLAGVTALAAVLLLLAVLMVRAAPGTLGARLAETFDSRLPLEFRASARPIYWRAAGRLFSRHPIEGEGMGSFAWRLPDLLLEEDRRIGMRDNPGSAYVQALAETGLPGFLLTAAFALALGAQSLARIRSLERDPLAGSAGAALAAFLLASLFGSHWFAADASLLFFLLVSVAALPGSADSPLWPRVLRGSAVSVYAVAAAVGILSTNSAEETFRYRPWIGFHEKEVAPGGAYRWTKKNFALWVEPGGSRSLELIHLPPLAQAVELTARLGDRVVFRRPFAPGETAGLRLNGASDRPRAFFFSLSRAFVPKRLRMGEDRRELGLRARLE